MKITRIESGCYIVSEPKALVDGRTWEVCKEYNSDTEVYDGKYWYIYETSNGMREWYEFGFEKKSDAIKQIQKIQLTTNK
jgi:hypothetical protein